MMPYLTEIKCPDPVLSNGKIIGNSGTNYKVGSYVMFQCNEGYSLLGRMFSSCGNNGKWGTFPICKGKVKASIDYDNNNKASH